ncbi:MAG TPA: AAA family ATPase [Isosphaeraceae bacterium]|nr:AAA family ATPase [Isosphaeraceae bacterium]
MYESHFGLKERPFRETVHPAAYVAVPSRERALRRLRYGLEPGRGPVVLFGPGGSGKTILSRRLVSLWPGPAVHVAFPMLPPAELVAHLAEEFGELGVPPPSLGAALRVLQNQLARMVAENRRPLLIIDEAHLIAEAATFDALRLLLNFTTDGSPDLSLLLVGGAEVLLDLPPALADRLAARCLIGPLSEAETASYVLGRLAAAGAQAPVFSPEALNALHHHGSGLPRRLNRVADLALLIAYAQELPIVEAHTVLTAAREFNHDSFAA